MTKSFTRAMLSATAFAAILAILLLSFTSAGTCADHGIITPVPAVPAANGTLPGFNESNNNPSASPVPTASPVPRKVFSNPIWENDHVSITVNNSLGRDIEVRAYIDDPSNLVIIPIGAGVIKKVSTLSINAENGEIINFGFKAYENNVLIDTKEAAITVIKTATPTPLPPETATIGGVVVDSATNSPIVGAEVDVESRTYGKKYSSVFTDEYGSFETGKIYPDSYVIIVKAQGYRPQYVNIDRVDGNQKLTDPISLEKYASVSPTPGQDTKSPLDAWVTLLTTPTMCVGTVSSMVAVLVSLTVIYEWLQRQKERRAKEARDLGSRNSSPVKIANSKTPDVAIPDTNLLEQEDEEEKPGKEGPGKEG